MTPEETRHSTPWEPSGEASVSSQAPSVSEDEFVDALSQPADNSSDIDPRGFRGGNAPGPNDAFIAVMGITGSGKSSFISKCCAKPVTIGHKQGSCTSVVDVYPYEVSADSTVYLIDTPGFDDTDKSDTEVLKEIAAWLSDSYQHKILLHGIIYLHRISDIRMQGSARRNLMTFRKLCGNDALKKVILASTMWDITREEDAIMREQELKDTDEFWGWMVEQGSSCHRYNNTAGSARQIVLSLTGHKSEIVTDLQREMVDDGLTLNETAAGQNLDTALQEEIEKLTRGQKELEEEIKIAEKEHDRKTQEILQQERDRNTAMLQKAHNNTRALKATMEILMAKRDKQVAEMKNQLEVLQARETERRLRLLKEQALEGERSAIRKRQREQQLESKQNQQLLPVNQRLKNPNLITDGQNYKMGEVKNPPTKTWFSISLHGEFYLLNSPEHFSCNLFKPLDSLGGKRIEFACLGGSRPGEWIARYANHGWAVSKNFGEYYPDMTKQIKSYGLGNLDICALGPNQQYYARWLDGSWSCQGLSGFPETIRNLTTRGCKIKAISFGFGGSYFVSFELSNGYLDWKHDLKGYYDSLDMFLKEHGNISIHTDMWSRYTVDCDEARSKFYFSYKTD
ncbi:hypothetical protein FHETE_1611 [Fusarium heterosporum]|uniref:G domain-containing protein n=1 Tax=Fusarium heterosporum TaxID=42747 RepID=A0A8H5TSG7_FUSHE|nr:hypothetical protein FHETE_1611 [Fusarium heterosporum]